MYICSRLVMSRFFYVLFARKNGALAGAALKGRNGMKKPVYRNISAGGKEVTGGDGVRLDGGTAVSPCDRCIILYEPKAKLISDLLFGQLF